MMKRRTVCIFAALLALVYAGLIGAGAYLQYDAGRQFDRMMEDSAAGSLSPEDVERHQQTAERSESLKQYGRALGYFAAGVCLLLTLVKFMGWKDYLLVVGAALGLGLLVTLPWLLRSGDHLVNYYHEQLFVVLAGLIGGAVAGGAGLLREKSR
jgi:hypothetical protein